MAVHGSGAPPGRATRSHIAAAPAEKPAAAHTLTRFGEPSSYSLGYHHLRRHVRALRNAGWQEWEIEARFDFGWRTVA